LFFEKRDRLFDVDQGYFLHTQNTKPPTSQAGLRSRLISGVLWNLVAMIASRGSTFVALVVVARVLGAAEYGALSIIQSTIGMFGTLAGMGLGITCTKYLADLRRENPQRAGRVVALTHSVGWLTAGLLAILLLCLAPWLAVNCLSNPALTSGLRWAAPLLLFSTLTGVQGGTLAGFEAFRVLARIGVIQGVLSFPLILAGVYWHGIEGAVVGMGLGHLAGYLLNLSALHTLLRESAISPCYRSCWREREILQQTALPSMLSGIMVGPVVWYANALLVNTPGGYAQFGIFNAACQWKELLVFIPAVVGRVLLPMLSSTATRENSALEAFNLIGNWMLVSVIALVLMALPEGVSFFYGSAYNGSNFNDSLALMMLVSCILAYKEGIARKLVVSNLLWWGILSNFVWAAIFLAWVYLFRFSGATSMAYAYVVSYVINTLIFVPFYIRRKVISRNLLLSGDVLVAWCVIVFVLSMTLFTDLIWLRLVGLISAFVLLWLTFKDFVSKIEKPAAVIVAGVDRVE
jgi:O-antigen/teichoic acid export membrane protein